jgi:hypothetical protein
VTSAVMAPTARGNPLTIKEMMAIYPENRQYALHPPAAAAADKALQMDRDVEAIADVDAIMRRLG